MSETSKSYADFVCFLFLNADSHQLDKTLRSLGAHPKLKGPGWVFPPSAVPLLDFNLVDDIADYAIDLVWDAWEWHVPLLEALGIGMSDWGAVMLHVSVRDDNSAQDTIRTFALKLLENHSGAVKDGNTDRVWTREEIENEPIRNGQTFFGKGGSVTESADTA